MISVEVFPRRTVGRSEFTDWVRPNWPVIVRVANRLGAPAECEDIVQDALTAARRARGAYDPAKGTVRAWLLAITARQALKAAHKSHPLELVREPAHYGEQDTLDLQRALRGLPPRQRQAIWLHYYYCGLSMTETAAALGCAAGTVKSTLFDARTALRGVLKGELR